MPRRCVDCARANSGSWVRGVSRLGSSVALATVVLLAGCSSAPPLPPLETYPTRASTAAPAPAGSPATNSESPPSATGEQTAPVQESPSAAVGVIPPLTLSAGDGVTAAAQQQFDTAVALAQSADLVAAERAFDTLSAQYPDYSGPLINLAILRAKAGKLEPAQQALQAAIERNPSSAPAFNHLGIVYRRLGRFGEADAAYKRAVELDPNYANAYLNLGVLCDLYLQQPQRALQAFERYLELVGKPDAKVSGWVSELKARIGNSRSARSEQ